MPTQRQEMLKVFAEKGTVIHKGVHYKSVDELPSEADLARGNERLEAATAEQLRDEIKRLESQLSTIDKPKSETKNEKAQAENKK